MHFIHLGSQKILKGIMEYYYTLVGHLICIKRMPIGLNISPSIWQSYINAVLECLQSRKYCQAIMDDLLLFTSWKKSHIAKLEDLLQALPKNRLEDFPKEVSVI